MGNVIGAGVAFLATRHLLAPRLIGNEGKLASTAERLSRHGFWVVLLLRVNPLTSSDFVSYAAGLTSMSLPRLLTATGLGMAPLCFAQAYLAESLLESMPWLLYPLIVAGVAYVVWAVVVVKALVRQSPDD